MGLITSAGLGSGLDVNSIIGAIINAEAMPIKQRLDLREADAQAKISALGGFSSALSELRTAIEKLDARSDFNLRKVSLSKSEYITVTAASTASIDTNTVEVVALAKGSKRESAAIVGGSAATFGAGKLTFTAGSKSFSVDVLGTDTLEQIRQKVNAASGNFGVSASIIVTGSDTKISFNSTVTGATNSLSITNDNAALDAISTATVETQPASDGEIKINGVSTTNSTNTYTSITDLTITAIKENVAAETTTVTVAADTAGIKSAISGFAKALDAVFKQINELTSNKQGAQGVMAADGGLRGIATRLKNMLTKTFDVDGNYNSLTRLGFTSTKSGGVELKTATLDSALSGNFDAIVSLFTDSSGFATELKNAITGITGSNGVLPSRTDSLNAELKRITKEREALSVRVSKMETRLRAQYGALDALAAKFKGTSSFISQNLARINSGQSS